MRECGKEPVRVAHVVGKMVGGGVEATVVNYYRHLDRNRIQYDFLIDADSTLIPEEIEKLGGRVILIPPYQHPIQYHRELRRLFRNNHYQMVYAHLNTLSVFPLFAAWRAGVPIRVAHNHSTAGRGEWRKNLMKYALRPLAKVFPTHLCACSRFAGAWLFGEKAMREGRVTVWQNAVEIERFLYDEARRMEIRRAMRLEGRLVVGHVGRFIHQKNHAFIVDVFREVHRRNPNAVLVLVGSGELMPKICERVRGYGLEDAVIFAGNRSDIESLYLAMDVFLMPSFYEGLGMVAVEAQISGLPVICADTVPAEAKICDNLHFLRLEDDVNRWADELLKCAKQHTREEMRLYAEKAGYDIHTAAARMMQWYLDELKMVD